MKTSRYVLNENGTVLDTSTRLMWMRPALGQTWNGKTCVGEAKRFNWEEACKQTTDFAGYSDWRLPTVEELKTIIEQSQQSGAKVNPLAFPNCPASFFWASSDDAYYSRDAWGVYFSSGNVDYYNRRNSNHVRLVRGGQ